MPESERCLLPAQRTTEEGAERRVGVEVELSGLSFEALVERCAQLLEGKAEEVSRYVHRIDTQLGAFTVELDSDPIKELDLDDERLPDTLRELGSHARDLIDFAAERIVPLEIVSPPIPMSELETMEVLCDHLREAGALGSRNALHYAFGLQLNPELPDLQPATLVRYFRAFACLYDWLKSRHQLDVSRKFTLYIEPWDSDYLDILLAPDYTPALRQLMTDYLHHNPTRNRALDLLPLFAHLDETLVARYVDDPRIKARPTLHYRLPDCDIDNPQWHFSTVWNDWIVVERLVEHPALLDELTALFKESRSLSLRNLTSSWKDRCDQWLKQHHSPLLTGIHGSS
ncbi:MAG: amidoligase family protein [Marinobacter sp.]|nr:amidoligase family protein [Marinobacter sp.]